MGFAARVNCRQGLHAAQRAVKRRPLRMIRGRMPLIPFVARPSR